MIFKILFVVKNSEAIVEKLLKNFNFSKIIKTSYEIQMENDYFQIIIRNTYTTGMRGNTWHYVIYDPDLINNMFFENCLFPSIKNFPKYEVIHEKSNSGR